MTPLNNDELRDKARRANERILANASRQEEKARDETVIAQLLDAYISPFVPVHFWTRGGIRSMLHVHLHPLPLENGIDMLTAHPPTMVTQLRDGNAVPTNTLTEQDRMGNYRDVARFYMRAQYDQFGTPHTDARLCWWSYLYEDQILAHFTMPLADSDNYLVCQYVMQSPRSRKVRLNNARTRLPGVQARVYSGGDRDAPRHFYLHWDMRMTLKDVIDGMQEEWYELR